MKKRIFFAMLISAFAAGSFLVSCDDDDDEVSGCTCTAYYEGEEVTSETITAEEMKEEEYTSCSEIEDELNYYEEDPSITYECR